MSKGSVKLMLSYDYCHFEIALSSDEEMTLEQIDNMRKDAQRLCDKAVNQYKIAKQIENKKLSIKIYIPELQRQVKIIKENYPISEWTDEQKAKIKTLEDYEFILNTEYDYNDDFNKDFS